MGAAMGSEAFKEMSDSLGFAMTYGPATLIPPPDGPPPADAPPPNMCAIVEVNDLDAWYSGFMEHGKNKSVKGLELTCSRSEMCDDSKTMVYRSMKSPNKVMMALFGIQNDVMGKADLQEVGVARLHGEDLHDRNDVPVHAPLVPHEGVPILARVSKHLTNHLVVIGHDLRAG